MVLQTLETGGEEAYDHEVVDVRRVSRTMKGGRRFRFRAAVLVGNRKGRVGFAVAKGKDVPAAIEKAQAAARKRLVVIPLRGGSIPHSVKAKFGGARVLLKPAPEGAGVMAGGSVRILASLAGIRDLSSKSLGSRNEINTVRAALKALTSIRDRRPAGSD